MTATGTLGGSITMLRQLGRNIGKRASKPTGQPSAAQIARRLRYEQNCTIWSALNADQKSLWNAQAARENITPFNAFLRSVMGRTISLRTIATISDVNAITVGADSPWKALGDDDPASYVSPTSGGTDLLLQPAPAPPPGSIVYMDVEATPLGGWVLFILRKNMSFVAMFFSTAIAETSPKRYTYVLTPTEIGYCGDFSGLDIFIGSPSGACNYHSARLRYVTPA